MEHETYNDYSGDNIINNLIQVILKKRIYVLLLLLVYLTANTLMIFYFKEDFSLYINSTKINNTEGIINIISKNYILSIISSIFISTIILGLLSRITYKEIVKDKIELSYMRQFFNFFLMYTIYNLVIVFVTLFTLFVGLIFLLIPIIGRLIAIGIIICGIIFLIYFLGYYRFIPYIAFTEGLDGVFAKSKRFITGHFKLSVFIAIFISSLSQVITYYANKAIVYNKFTESTTLIILLNGLMFLLFFFDIGFVFTGCKQENLINAKSINYFKDSVNDSNIFQ